MKRFSEQLKKQTQSIRLTSVERAELRARLSAYMAYHPLPGQQRLTKQTSQPATPGRLVSQPFTTIAINWLALRGTAAAFVLLLVVAIPTAAEHTKPGDTLYPVKVRFNEEVRSTLTLNPYEKIEWETERLERRVAEARLLAGEGKLTDSVEAQVAEAVKAHSVNAKQQISALRESNSNEAAIAEIAFATALSVQAEVLDKTLATAPEQTTVKSDGSIVSSPVGATLASVIAEETSAAVEQQQASTPSVEALMAHVESETTTASELFIQIKKQASGDQVRDIERRLADISRKVAAVQAARASSSESTEPSRSESETTTASEATASSAPAAELATTTLDATTSQPVVTSTTSDTTTTDPNEATPPVLSETDMVAQLTAVLTDLRKLITFMTDISVRQSVTVEELVPLTPTTEERTEAVRTRLNQLDTFLKHMATITVTGELGVKVNQGIKTVAAKRTEAVAALESKKLAVAESATTEAVALATDIEKLTAGIKSNELPTPASTATSSVASTTNSNVSE